MSLFRFTASDGRRYYVLANDPSEARVKLQQGFPSIDNVTLQGQYDNLETGRNALMAEGSNSVGVVLPDGTGTLTGGMNFAENRWDEFTGSAAVPPGQGVPGAPLTPEEGANGLSVAFQRALDALGVPAGIARGRVSGTGPALQSVFDIGGRLGRTSGAFSGMATADPTRLGESFFTNALNQIRGGQNSLPQIALNTFLADPANALAAESSRSFLTPEFSADASSSDQYNELRDAEQFANLGRLAARAKLGYFARYLPGASDVVTDYRAQPQGADTTNTDFRSYIRSRYGF